MDLTEVAGIEPLGCDVSRSNTSPTHSSDRPQPPRRFFVAQPGLDFNEASAAVVDYVKTFLPMGFWAVALPDRELFGTLRGLDPAPRSDQTRDNQARGGTIKLVASVIQNTIRDTDIAARLGGEEFGIIVTNVLLAGRQKLVGRLLVDARALPISDTGCPSRMVNGQLPLFDLASEVLPLVLMP